MSNTQPGQAPCSDEVIYLARRIAVSSSQLFAHAHYLTAGLAWPDPRKFVRTFVELTLPARLLTECFPRVSTKFAGLVHQQVEHYGHTGASAIDIVYQVAQLIVLAGEDCCLPATDALETEEQRDAVAKRLAADLTPSLLEHLAEQVHRARAQCLDQALRTLVEVELATLQRQMPSDITRGFGLFRPPPIQARLHALFGHFLQKPVVVYPSRSTPEEREVRVQFDERRAIVTEGETERIISGPTLLFVFKTVVEADGSIVKWEELVRQGLRRAIPKAERGIQRKTNAPVRLVTMKATLQKASRRICKRLGKLDYHWQRAGDGARWDKAVQ